MESLHSKIDFDKYKQKSISAFRSRRDELVDNFVNEINTTRDIKQFGKITKKEVAIRLAMNPYFKGRDGEAELLLKECVAKGNFKKFFACCPMNKKLSPLLKKDPMGL